MPARKARAPGWGPETLLRELEADPKVTVRDICRRYCLETDHQALESEVERWRARDPDFAARYSDLLDVRAPARTFQGGPLTKEEKDPSLGDWRLTFCEDLFRTGSRLKAAELSPYSYESIYQRITEGYPLYEPDFSQMVHLVEMRLCAEMEGAMVEAMRGADAPRDRAWIAKTWLERRDPTRWGRQVELLHTGSVKHDHTHTHRLSREERLEALAEDQQAFLDPGPDSRPALPAAVEGEVIDVEPLTEPELVAAPTSPDAQSLPA